MARADAPESYARASWPRPRPRDLRVPLGSVPPSALILLGILSVQLGAGVAKNLFATLSPDAVVAMRLLTSAVVLGVAYRSTLRDLRRLHGWRDIGVATLFGLTLAGMNFSFYQALARIPLGVAVTIEFVGPLSVAIFASRRRLDLLWALLALGGVTLLARGGGDVSLTGVMFALLAAAGWAGYILLSGATGRRFSGSSGLALASIVGAAAVLPAGIATGGTKLLAPGTLLLMATVGLLSSVIPYTLELEALRRIPARVFGILMSLEPAVGALVGLAFLGEVLRWREWLAIASVILACVGAARFQQSSPEAPEACPGSGARAGAHTMRGVRSENPIVRLCDLVWRPTPAAMRGLALASVAGNALIMATGAAVRVSGSGLGCPSWPRCTGDSLVPTHSADHPAVNMAIEFGNRMLTFLVLAFGVAIFVATLRLRPRRRDLVRLAAIQPFSVVLQAIVGGIVVLTDLHPASVTAHFLISPLLLAAAVALWVRAGEGDDPARPVVRPELVWLGRALTVVVFVLLIAGAVVTGTGPHAGDAKARRYGFKIQDVAQLHVDVVWVTVGLTFALLLGLRLTDAPARARRRAVELLAVELAQGFIGYVQYFTGVPAVLVVLHVLGSALVWIATLQVILALRDRGEPPPASRERVELPDTAPATT